MNVWYNEKRGGIQMNIVTYQTTPEKHGNGTSFLQTVDIICIP